ncbi:MAG TPA: type II secretion system F family protein [Candidatus Paceibacterota bacterium]|nr:type II secretion system F family protein [Candidatus Paceibacterota bacterium]
MIKIKKIHIMGIIVAVLTIVADLIFLMHEKVFYFILGIAVVVAAFPFMFSFLMQAEKEKEKEEMFLEFARNLVESVKSGTPISRSILNVKEKDYGSLTPHVDKLGNQISLGIPVRDALEIFAKDVNSKTISRAVNLIGEAEQAGGEIESVLESVARSVSQTETLKKERKAAIYNLVVQGYIIFIIFIIIMLIMEFKIIPMTTEINLGAGAGGGGLGEIGFASPIGMGNTESSIGEITRTFLYLLLVQGFFAGLTIGKLAEGKIKSGIKHSFILMVLALLISTGARAFFG